MGFYFKLTYVISSYILCYLKSLYFMLYKLFYPKYVNLK